MKRALTVLILLMLGLVPGNLPAADSKEGDVWKPFQFLIGDWLGGGGGKPGDAAGEFSFTFDLDKHLLVRRNRAVLSGKPGEKSATTHEDLMVIYQEQGKPGFRADYFDNEGHVIHYATSFAENKAVFESEPAPNTPRFRLTYELKTDGILSVEFAMAMPGKDFQPYVTGTAKKK